MRLGGVGEVCPLVCSSFLVLKLETFPNLHAQEEMDEAMAMLATNSRALFDADKVRECRQGASFSFSFS